MIIYVLKHKATGEFYAGTRYGHRGGPHFRCLKPSGARYFMVKRVAETFSEQNFGTAYAVVPLPKEK